MNEDQRVHSTRCVVGETGVKLTRRCKTRSHRDSVEGDPAQGGWDTIQAETGPLEGLWGTGLGVWGRVGRREER